MKNILIIQKNICLVALLSFVLIACQSGNMGGSIKLNSDKDKQSYAIGVQMGKGIKRQEVDVDVRLVAAAIQDVVDGKKLKLSDEDIQKQIVAVRTQQSEKRKKASEENVKKGEAFLAKNKERKEVTVTESGLQYEVVTAGKGTVKPKPTDKVQVHYKGTLTDGTEFDSSYKRDKPSEFRLNQVIKGWTEGLGLMTEGSKWKLYIPANLAYGPAARPGIPGNSVLIFDVELLKIL